VDGRAGRPFFAFLNYYDAHGPYLPPKSWDGHFGAPRSNDLSPIHRFMIHPGPKPRTLPAPVVQAERDQYDDAIGYLDAQLGQLFDSLQQRGMLDHTVVLLTADHGEEFGEHGVFDHGNSLYRPSVQVPLLVVYPPAVPAGRRVASPVTVRDVAATLSDLAGIAAPEAQGGLPGRSLARFWQSDSALGMQAVSPVLSEVSRGIRTAPWFPVSLGDMRSLVDSQYRYILGGDRTEQLFALGDVWETHSQVPDDSLLGAFRDRLQRMPWRH
jgi:arylsulfatase A-like enzyme